MVLTPYLSLASKESRRFRHRAALIVLLILESGMRISPTFPYGLSLIFASVASFLLVDFIKDICAVTPILKNRLSSISAIHRRYLSPLIGPAIDGRSSKTTYSAISVLLIVGAILTALGLNL